MDRFSTNNHKNNIRKAMFGIYLQNLIEDCLMQYTKQPQRTHKTEKLQYNHILLTLNDQIS